MKAINEKKIYDITMGIKPGMLLWPGDPPVIYNRIRDKNNLCVTHLALSVHAGTHIDAPLHIDSAGRGVEIYELEDMMGMARVCLIEHAKIIDRATLEKLDLAGVTRLLLKTSNSLLLEKSGFNPNYISLDKDAAAYIVEKGIKFIALDYLSVESYDSPDYSVHKLLLSEGVIVAEGVFLSMVPEGDYEMFCFPLKLENCDGAPVRIVLRTL